MSFQCIFFHSIFSSVQYMSALYLTIFQMVIWAFKADRLFPCWCWLKLASKCTMRIESWHVVKYLGSEVNLSLCMFFRSKIPQDSASSRTLPCLNCWVEVGLVARVTDLDSICFGFAWIVETMLVLWQGLVLGDNESHLCCCWFW